MKAKARKRRFTKEQRKWCENYEKETGFEPLMDDYLYGNERFFSAAIKSVRWFEEWASDAHLNIGRGIPV
jgi:hypothetical protein